jgi:hypothetical protein
MRRILGRAVLPLLTLALVLIILCASSVSVQAATPAITINPISGLPGTVVTVAGSGFSANETGVRITFDSNPITPAITADSLGNWSGTFTVSTAVLGPHTVSAFGSITPSGVVPNVTFTLLNPSLSISPANGPPGTVVTVTGSGFAASETGITITFDGNPVASGISANSLGNWSGTFIVPASSPGAHSVSAYGPITLSGFVLSITFIVPNRILAINPRSGPPGTVVTVTGSGFGAGETGITITFDGNPVASGISANSLGNWSGTFTVPAAPSGAHTVSAYGSMTPARFIPSINFMVSPAIAVSTTSRPPGGSVTVTGSGFSAGETGITITFDGNPVASGISANSLGNWSGTFTVPAVPLGSHTVSAYGSITLAGSIPSINFMVNPTIAVNPTSRPPGSPVTVTGSGFGAGETGITITFDGNPVASGISANSLGNWSGTFTVPDSPSGSHTVSAYGSITLAGFIPSINFMVNPTIAINPTNGPPGGSVTVTGSGFGAGETGITITFDGNPVASGISANSLGNWSGTFTIPASVLGSHSVGAKGSITQGGSLGGTNFGVTPGISLKPVSGYVGSTVQISGSGFAVNSTLTFTYDDKEILAEGVTTDATGSFVNSFVVPKSKAGGHTISVTDVQGNSAKTTFSMDSTPPPVPVSLSPEDGARIGILGDITPTFTWSNVSDPSGVTYSFQVDMYPDFSQPVLDKTDITASHYTLTAAEALPRGQFYWRVKAIDGASNESAWSQVRLLMSGLMPLWALVLIILVGIAAVGSGGYFGLLLLKTRRRQVFTVPEIAVPHIIKGEWREIESAEETPKLPWRLSLPEPTKGAKKLSTEDQARLIVIIDFAQSLPLVEPGYNVNWLVDLIETGRGIKMSAPVYKQLLKDGLEVNYEPQWTRHPIYQDLLSLLEGQSILQDLNGFVDAVNRCASQAVSFLQDIYQDTIKEAPPGFMKKGGWEFISSVYADAVSWFRGKFLYDPSERDYIIKPQKGLARGTQALELKGEETTSFAGPIIRASSDEEALRLRSLHLKLRWAYRDNNRAKEIATMLTQLEVQRRRLLIFFSEFGRLKQ